MYHYLLNNAHIECRVFSLYTISHSMSLGFYLTSTCLLSYLSYLKDTINVTTT